MRTRTAILTGALLLASSGFALAQQTQTQAPTASAPSSFAPKYGQFDFGFRVDNLDGDEARYNRLRDLRRGPVFDRFRFVREEVAWYFRAEANNVGYRDQRFFGDFQSIGKLKASFEWTEVPLFYSKGTRSIYTDAGNGELQVNDAIQQSIQNATALGTAARDAAINAAFASAPTRDLRSGRDTANFNLVYTLNRDVDLKFNLKNMTRSGNQPFSFGFGTSPGLFPSVELGVPLDDRTTDLRGSIEFANAKGMLSLGYNGSWYDNQVPFVRFDNPTRRTDDPIVGSTGGSSVGLAAWWPANSAFSVNATGAYTLAKRTRATVGLSVGRWNQDEALPAYTVNTALVSPALMRPTADAKADILSLVFNLNSRPVQNVWLNAKYRYYDYDNKVAHFEASNAVIGDWNVTTQHHENEPTSFKRKTLDLDASFTPHKYAAFGIGFGREDADRTWRIFDSTAENTFRLTFDSTANQYVTLRTKYEYSRREGSGFEQRDEGHSGLELLDEVGEQPGMRHFDIADRKRNRATAIVTITPIEWFAVNGSVATGRDEYDETGFGLRDNKNNAYGIGFDVIPMDTVSFGLNYGREKYTAFQYSRTANPLSPTNQTFLDPTRDWSIDQDDRVNTFTASLDLIKALPKTDIRFSYDLSDGKATYVYGGPATTNPSVFSAVPLRQLTPVKNELSGARFDVQYFVRPNVALGVGYWYEDYKVEDFALGEATIGSLVPTSAANGLIANTFYSGYMYRPYTAHTGWLRMTYLW